MGMFSWITSDTNRSIPNMASDRPPIPVWMLLPSGKRAVFEPRYAGYGDFGGCDFFFETAAATLGLRAIKGVDYERVRVWGVELNYLESEDDRKAMLARRPELAWWLLHHKHSDVRRPRLVESRCAYSSVPDSKYCPDQGF